MTATDWSLGTAPTASNDATIAVAGTYAVTIGAGELDAANSLTMSDANATLADDGTLALNTTLALTAGTFTLGENAELSGGTITVGAAAVFNAAGGGTLSGASYIGALNLTSSGAILNVIGGLNANAGGGSAIINVTGAGNAYLDLYDTQTLNNATLNIGNASADNYFYLDRTAASGTFTLGSAFRLTTAGSLAVIDFDNSNETLINQGTISANTNGGTLNVYDAYGGNGNNLFINTGSLIATNGDKLLLDANVGTAGLGNFSTSSGGVLELAHGYALGNGGATLSLSTAAELTLAGTIDGGTVNDAGGGLVAIGGTLSGVTCLGTLNLTGSGAALNVTGGLNVNSGAGSGVINLTGAGSAYLDLYDTQTLNMATLSIGNASATNYLYLDETAASGTFTLGSALHVTTAGVAADIYFDNSNETLINQGMMTAGTNGGTLDIYDPYGGNGNNLFTNTGSLVATNGGKLLLDVNVTTAGLGNFSTSSGGVLELDRGYAFGNGGATLTLSTAAELTLAGTIDGGTVNDSGGGLVGVGGTLSGVIYFGTLNLASPAAALVINGGLDVNSGAGSAIVNVTGASANLDLYDTQTLNNATLTIGNASLYSYLYLNRTAAAGTFTLGSAFHLTTAGKLAYIYFENSNQTLVNQGTMTASISGGTLNIYDAFGGNGNNVFTNSGSLVATGGDTLLLDVNVAGLGNFSTSSGGVLELGGAYALSNSGATLNLSTAAELTLAGTIIGGTVADLGGGLLAAGGTLSGVTYLGTLSLGTAHASLTVKSGLNLSTGGSTGVINVTGNGANLDFEGSQTVDNATINLGNASGYAYLYAAKSVAGTLTFGSHLSVDAAGKFAQVDYDNSGAGETLINEGDIVEGLGGDVLAVVGPHTGDQFSNLGTVLATNGGTIDLSGAGVLTNYSGGTLTAGTFEADANSTVILPGASGVVVNGSTLVLNGAGSVIESYNSATGSYVSLDSKLGTITSTGALELLGGRNFAAATGIFNDAGALQLGGGTFTAATSFTLASSGSVTGFGTVKANVLDSGAMTASGGTLTIAGTVSGAGALGAAAGATLDLSAGGALSEAISGAGTLKLDGNTAYTLAAGNDVTIAAVQIDAGATLSGAGTLGGAVSDAGTLAASGGTLVVDGAVTGGGALQAGGASVLDLAGGGTLSGAISGAGTLQLDGATAFTLAGGTIAMGTVAVDAGATLSGNGTLTGALVDNGTLTASGGMLALAGAVSGGGALQASAGATLDLRAGGALLPAQFSGAGTLQLDGATAYTLAGGILAIGNTAIDAGATLSGSGTLTGFVIDNGTLATNGGALVLAGAISGSGTLVAGTGTVLDLQGGGTLTSHLSGGGTLKLDGAAYALAGSAAGVANVTVDAGATLSGTGTLSGVVRDAGNIAATGGRLTLAGGVSGTGSLVANAAAVLDLFGGGALGENISGAGTLQLDGAAAFQVPAGAALTVASVQVDAGATLALNSAGSLPGSFTGAGTLQLGGNKAYTLGGGTEAVGNVVLLAGSALSGPGTIAGNLTAAGILSTTGGILDLTGGGTFSGTVKGSGTLQLDAATYTLGGIALATTSLTVDAGATLGGSGSVTGTAADAGTIEASGGTLTLSGPLSGSGTLAAAAGALLNVAHTGPLATAITGAGTVEISAVTTLAVGASLSVANFIEMASFALASGENLTNSAGDTYSIVASTGTVTLYGGSAHTLTNAGDLTTNGSGAVHIAVDVDNTGTISVTSGTLTLMNALTDTGALSVAASSLLYLQGGGSLAGGAAGGGTLELHGAAYTLAGTTAFDTAGLVVDTGAHLSGSGTIQSALANNGTIVASGGKLVLAGNLSGIGALQAATGAVLDLTAGGTLSQAISGGGTLELGGAYVLGSTLPAIAGLAVDSGATLSGTGKLISVVADAGSIAATSGTLTLAGALSGSGTLSAFAATVLDVTKGGSFGGAITGAGTVTVAGVTTLTEGASLSVANFVQTAGVTLGSGENITNGAGDRYTINASSGATVTLAGGGAVDLTNAGTLVANGAGTAHVAVTVINSGAVSVGSGTLQFLNAVTNTGTFSASAGSIILSADVAGTGTLSLGATGTLSLLNGAGAGQSVDFLAGTGLLDLTSPLHFLGTVAGFGGSDTIDLINTAETSYGYNAGVLTVTDNGATVAKLNFAGSYVQGDFVVNTDNHGGTDITFV